MIELNYRDSRPIYEQVKDGLRKLVVTGAIAPGDKLPSVRQMASQLAINPNTIQKAYEALEQEGYVYSVPGKGSFAAPGSEMDGRRRDELFRQLDTITEELRYLGVTAEEIAAHCAGKKEEKP
jgi:GntR family transcriptional regulator